MKKVVGESLDSLAGYSLVEAPAPEPGDTTPAPVQKTCEELYPGPADATNRMRVLCEHQP
jgi:hypothetical protein